MLKILNRYYPIRNILFFIVEGVLIYLAVLGAAYLRFEVEGWALLTGDSGSILLKALLVSIICQMCLYYNDLYDFRVVSNNVELVIRLLQAIGASYLVLAFLFILMPSFLLGRGVFVITLFFLIAFIVSWRLLYNWILKTKRFDQHVVIVGAGAFAHTLADSVEHRRDSGFKVVGFVGSPRSVPAVNDDALLGDHSQIGEIVQKNGVERIVVAMEERRGTFPARELLRCRLNGVDVEEGVTFFERVTGKITVENMNPSWLIFSPGFKKTRLRRSMKRLVGIIISGVGLVVASPIVIGVAILIRLESRGPIFYTQERVGENGRPFQVLKFRSMVQDAESDGKAVWATEDDPRVTRIGRIIRKLRIDEIPQVINVLRGDMSFVGPRPERPQFVQELESHIPYYSLRHSVKPGITGWAQICYPYGSSIADAREKLHYDLYYIKNMSIVFDLLIIFNTVKIILFGTGAR